MITEISVCSDVSAIIEAVYFRVRVSVRISLKSTSGKGTSLSRVNDEFATAVQC